MILRKAEGQDFTAILRIQDESIPAPQWQGDDYLHYVCTVAEIEGAIAGYLLTRKVAEGEFEILNAGVAREFRRRGVASSLIRMQIEKCKGEWFLEVRVSNDAARSLYAKAGFVEAGVRRLYYEHPTEDGIVMRFRSC